MNPNPSPAPDSVVLLGVPFHVVDFPAAVDWCVQRMKSGPPGYVATANLDFIMQAWRDPELQRILLEADLVIADGMPILWLARLFGPPLPERVRRENRGEAQRDRARAALTTWLAATAA